VAVDQVLTMTRKKSPACRTGTNLKDRPLLSPIQAGGLAAVFKVLANDTRLRLLHALVRAGEMCVTDLAAALGMKPQAVSNQLQRLSDLGVLASRRDGNNVHYTVVDVCVSGLLEQGWCLMESGSGAGVTGRAAACCGGNQ
jgi:DNA-binding transcriptional ArsR family regulator